MAQVLDLEITEAGESDLDEFNSIMVDASEYDVLYQFFFHERREICVAQMKKLYYDRAMWMLQNQEQLGWFRFFKAVQPSSGRMLGIGMVRQATPPEGLTEDETKQAEHPAPPSGGVSCMKYVEEVCDITYRGAMAGKEHYVWEALYVRPEYQGKGIGKALLDWAWKEYNLSNERVYLRTANRMAPFYERLGWRTIGVTDVDLAHWGGDKMGFGIRRTVHLLREPSVPS